MALLVVMCGLGLEAAYGSGLNFTKPEPWA
jgi:hypothetical protein